MAVSSKQPSISIVIPTLNSGKVLDSCLQSVRFQKYNQNKIHILIIDGGSTDNTLEISHKYQCEILSNPLKTGEAGKAIGVKSSTSEYVALIDSDNILPADNWLTKMLFPLLANSKIVGSEPWEYTYRSNGGFIERYAALTGVNDPYTLIAGNYDRQNTLNGKWTGLKLKIIDKPNYQIVELPPKTLLPTIGANGTIFRRQFLNKYFHGNYLFDIDVISQALNRSSRSLLFAKVKIGIIHTFCESSINKFIKKQNRRATDLYFYQNRRTYPLTQKNLFPTLLFILYVIAILPMIFDTVKGYLKKPDIAWLFHPLACIITLYIYSLQTIRHSLGILKPINRQLWQQ